MRDGIGAVLALRAAGTSLVIDTAARVPLVLHWGADLGPLDDASGRALARTGVPATLNNAPDVPRLLSLVPSEFEGWSGTPGVEGHAGGSATTPRPETVAVRYESDRSGGGRIEIYLVDRVTALRTTITIGMDHHGVLTFDTTVVRDLDLSGAGPLPPEADIAYSLEALRTLLPVPERATELLDFSGKWCRERAPQRGRVRFGSHVRRGRRGKPGHDAPFLVVLGTDDLASGHGEAWGAHLAWSGDAEYLVERLPEGAGAQASVLGAGEALRPGEILLHDGDRYDAPTVLFLWSDAGIDGLSRRLHERLRARRGHPSTPRPLTLNSWEAVYFDHDLDGLRELIERGARVGVERFVLDDGWFRGRRAADAGLGDWTVDETTWPAGLGPLVDLVHDHGMQFGLWLEPEMISLDSELAREHPDWVLGPREGLAAPARAQYALDITRPEAFTHVLERISALVHEYRIDAVKWDHNRDLVEAVSRVGLADRPAVHAQTLAFYRLLDLLRERHPGLEIESCSGGGGRVDLGVIERTDRVWPSDCNDPVERLRIERWTRAVLPPELIGSHVGAERSHTTGRRTDLAFRLTVALTAHAGIEWDLREADEDELAVITRWAAMYREFRGLVASGRLVNADLADDETSLSGIVAADGSRALYTWARLGSSAAGQSGRIRLPGLDPRACYSVRVRDDLGAARRHQTADPAWVAAAARPDGVELPGAVLAVAGVPLPTLTPQQAMLFDVVRVP
ncbi:alpha-galactosidase [Curtobacterium sp. 22159]|uniref:alpha-galactosidase n=1 Tax=Curtobacterium sp. 22159 TaxID=3453882 RepID=UPI003F85D626